MKLVCLNVGLFEQNNSQVADFLSDQQPDILCLQEVTRRVDASVPGEYISYDAINQASPGLSHSFFSPVSNIDHFETSSFHGRDHFRFDLHGRAEFGLYFKSSIPITKGQQVFLQNTFTYVTEWSGWPDEQYRAVQVVDLQTPTTPLRIINYHGFWSKDKLGSDRTLAACEHLNQLATEVDYPSIICGDFNLFPDTPSMHVFTRHRNLVDEFDISTTRPSTNELSGQSRNVVDYVLVSPEISVQQFSVPDVPVSDHLPLVLEFALH